TANSVLTITVSQPSALTASFSYSPSTPVSGQSVTFTGMVSGGKSPYSYVWNLAGTLSSGNPVYRSFSNGTYNISLTVTDSSGNTTTSSRTLTVSSPPQPILTTISAINSGTYSTRDWVTQKHMYSSSG